MPILTDLKPSAPWREIKATPDDWAAADPYLLGSMLTNLHIIRAFEETVLEFASEGLMHGPAHSSIGQEGGAVGSCLPLRASDQVNGSHRGHHQFLAKALGYVAPEGLDPVRDLPEAVPPLLRRTLAEIAGLAEGFSRGEGDPCTCAGPKQAPSVRTRSSAAVCRWRQAPRWRTSEPAPVMSS
jgi:2-oxoisovalerate dehydrogenase E1 component